MFTSQFTFPPVYLHVYQSVYVPTSMYIHVYQSVHMSTILCLRFHHPSVIMFISTSVLHFVCCWIVCFPNLHYADIFFWRESLLGVHFILILPCFWNANFFVAVHYKPRNIFYMYRHSNWRWVFSISDNRLVWWVILYFNDVSEAKLNSLSPFEKLSFYNHTLCTCFHS